MSLNVIKKQKIFVSIFLLMGLLISTTNVFAQDPNFYIFLCFGQSNMEGIQGTIEAQDKTVDSRFQVMEAVNCSNLGRTMGYWYTAVPPLCRCYSGLTPADYFGRTMIENLPSNIKVGIVNVSVAGCKIELFDKNNYQAYVSTAPSWMIGIINEYGGNPYARLIEIAKLAQKDGVIKGILLHQGESNTGESNWPLKVKGVYDNLITDLELNSVSVPLLAGEVVNADQGGICAGVNSIIATLPKTVPNSYVISSKGCTDGADNLHFNAAGYRELGKRYAAKMLSLMGYQVTHAVEHNITDIIPTDFSLYQNYPNPFNPTTTINYSIPTQSKVAIKLYDVLGREILTIVDDNKSAGYYSVGFDAGKLVSGIYFYQMKTENYTQTRKMLLLR